jgi:hypothetical protein
MKLTSNEVNRPTMQNHSQNPEKQEYQEVKTKSDLAGLLEASLNPPADDHPEHFQPSGWLNRVPRERIPGPESDKIFDSLAIQAEMEAKRRNRK